MSNQSTAKSAHASLDALRAAFAGWRKNVEAELKGVPFEKKLVTKTPEGIALQPLYTRLDTAAIPAQDLAAARGDLTDGYHKAPWDFAQEIPLASPADFNAALLADLSRGQNAVAITLDRASRSSRDADTAPAADIGAAGLSINDLADLSAALHNVELSAIPVHIDAGATALPAASLLHAICKIRNTHPRKLSGSLTADPLGQLAATGSLPDSLDSLLDDLAQWTHYAAENSKRISTIGIDASLWHNAGGSAAHDLACALAALVEYIRELTTPARGLAPAQVLAKTRVTFAIGPQFFMEIAKFRAFRLLVARVATAFTNAAAASFASTGGNTEPNALDFTPGAAAPHSTFSIPHPAPGNEATVKIHARTGRWNKTTLDINVNMLRLTTEALSAILGGVDSLHIAPYDEVLGVPDDFSRRISRNIHTLLAEEFHFTAPADPSGGSFYIEKLTDELARRAWLLFQEIEAKGGFTAALRACALQAAAAATAKEKSDALDKRRSTLIGANLYPNLKEKPPVPRPPLAPAFAAARASEIKQRRAGMDTLHKKVSTDFAGEPTQTSASLEKATRNSIYYAKHGATIGQLFSLNHPEPTPEPAIPPVAPPRASAGYETLRAAADAHAQKTGSRPKIFVAKMGPVLQHKARADFTAGFFATGGFDLLAKESFDTAETAAAAALASGAPVAVLCSTDDTYPALAPAFAKTIKSANPAIKVILAGLPTDEPTITAYKTAGIDDFIHIRANNRAMLAALQKTIGV